MALSEKTSNAASTMAKADMAKVELPSDVERTMTDSQDDSSNAGTLNASGHRDALTRQYGLLGITGIAVAINNPWVVLGSSISVSILSGGPPGVIYGLLVTVFYYLFISLSIAELASSLPTTGGVYHWASVAAGPKRGRGVGLFTGWINLFGLFFGLASLVQICACAAIELYVTCNPSFSPLPWHVYVVYVLLVLLSAIAIIFANALIPYTQQFGLILIVIGGLATILVLAIMPSKHATSHFVWASFDENNFTGWTGGLAFMTGVLNGAFTVGTTDSVTHVAEEVHDPSRNLPKAILIQLGVALMYGLAFAVVLGYAIPDLSLLETGSSIFPLADIYRHATQNTAAAFVLLFIVFLLSFCSVIGALLTTSRTCWALARDDAIPMSGVFAQVSKSVNCPTASTLLVAVATVGLGAIPLGSSVGFTNLTGSFVILSTVSYAIPIASNLATGRRNLDPGYFHLGRFGAVVNYVTLALIVVFDVFFCFPPSLPVTPTNMSYNSVILCGVLLMTTMWWFSYAARHYPGPLLTQM